MKGVRTRLDSNNKKIQGINDRTLRRVIKGKRESDT